jgi:hypothetical protein
MNQETLYAQINLDEPWNSSQNKPFADSLVSVYQCPSDPDMSLNYVAIVGPQSVFQSSDGVSMSDITDGSSNAIVVVEALMPGVTWMEPL